MDDVTRPRKLIEGIDEETASYRPSDGDDENRTIFVSPSKGHDELMTVGCPGPHRVHDCILHADIEGGRIRIQHDGTKEGIADRQVAAGVPRGDIVLASPSPLKRRCTDFAVG